jgi:hypothetical protein
MMSRKMFAVGVALTLGLTGCAATTPPPNLTAPVAAVPTTPVTSDDDIFVGLVADHNPGVNLTTPSVREPLLNMAVTTCHYLDAGGTFASVMALTTSAFPDTLSTGYSVAYWATIDSVIVYCPQHTESLTAWEGTL